MHQWLTPFHGYSIAVATDDGKVRESGWIDIDLADTDDEQEEPADSESLEQELNLSLEEADLELPADDEGMLIITVNIETRGI